jgi:hypothetical protein
MTAGRPRVDSTFPTWGGANWTQALPGGAVAVVARPGRRKPPLAPFIFHHTGLVTGLHVSFAPTQPEARCDPDQSAGWRAPTRWRGLGAEACHGATLSCCAPTVLSARRGPGFPHGRAAGEVAALVRRPSARSVDRWARLIVSHDHWRSWETHRNGLPNGFAAYAGGFVDFAAGPSSRLAAAWSSDPGTDYTRFRLFISDDGRNWQHIPAGRMPKLLAGMAFTHRGALLLSAYPDEGRQATARHWAVSPGATTPQQVSGAPRARYGMQPACCSTAVALTTSPVIARTGRLTFNVSRDGKHWKAVVPDASLRTGMGQPTP